MNFNKIFHIRKKIFTVGFRLSIRGKPPYDRRSCEDFSAGDTSVVTYRYINRSSDCDPKDEDK